MEPAATHTRPQGKGPDSGAPRGDVPRFLVGWTYPGATALES